MLSAVRGDRAPGVQRAVDRVDDDAAPEPASPNRTSPRSSEIAVNSCPSACRRLQLGEHDVLAAAVDRERAVAALADALVHRSLARSRAPRRTAPAARRRRVGIVPSQSAPRSLSSGTAAHATKNHSRDVLGFASAPRGCRRASASVLTDVHERPGTRADRRAAAGRSSIGGGPLLRRRRRRDRGGRRRSRGGSRRSPTAGVAPERVLVLTRSRAAAGASARSSRGAARPPVRGAVDRALSGARRAAACASTRSRRGWTRSSRPWASPIGWRCCSTGSADLPLRRHEIRGNPAGLLARLLERIDTLKAEAVTAAALRTWAAERAREARAARPSARAPGASSSSPSCTRATTASSARREAWTPATWCIELARLLRDRADVRERLGERFTEVMADEYEDAGAAHRELLERARRSHGNLSSRATTAQAIRRFRAAAVERRRTSFRRAPSRVPSRSSSIGSLRIGREVARAAAAVAGDEPPARRTDDAGVVRFWRSRNRARRGSGGRARDRAPDRRPRRCGPSRCA